MDNLFLGLAAIAVGAGLGIIVIVLDRRGSGAIEMPRRDRSLEDWLARFKSKQPPKNDGSE